MYRQFNIPTYYNIVKLIIIVIIMLYFINSSLYFCLQTNVLLRHSKYALSLVHLEKN